MLIRQLLKHVASGGSPGAEVAEALRRASDTEFMWALDAGLGPMLLRAVADRPERLSARRQQLLRAADLTAKVLHGQKIEAALLVIDACLEHGIPITLLKGISTSEDLYAEGHFRRMHDIDLLVPREALPVVEGLAEARGFRRGSDPRSETLQHGVPMFHDQLGVWLEVHRSLFPSDSALSVGRSFGAENIRARTLMAPFHGRSVGRLAPSLQFAYVAAYWMRDITIDRFHPGCVIALFDAALLLSRHSDGIRNDVTPDWLDNDVARASLQVVLPYLSRLTAQEQGVKIAPPGRLWRVGRLEMRLMHGAFDRYLLGGREWPWPVSPPVPGRYNAERQLAKRRNRRPQISLSW